MGVGVGAAQESAPVETLEERMTAVQDELHEATMRVERLRMKQEDLLAEIGVTDLAINAIERRNEALAVRTEAIARDLYMNGGDGTLEAWFGSSDLGEVASRMEYVEAVAEMNDEHIERFGQAEAELHAKRSELEAQSLDLRGVEQDLATESAALQERFLDAQDEYEALKAKLEAEERRKAAALAAREKAATEAEVDGADGGPPGRPGMVCPVDGPHSFIDSWGFPRSGGRTHEGADIFAAMGAPAVAITDGEITYAGIGSLSGNWLILTGDDGHEYMYMHNQENLITSGRVSAGEQIATVGDTGNAQGTPPHIHFEYHPNAGGPVNPFQLLDSIC